MPLLSRLLWIFLTATVSSVALGDLCSRFDGDAAAIVQQKIAVGDTLLHYCENCGMEEPFPVRVRSVNIIEQPWQPRETWIGGKRYSYGEVANGELPGVPEEQRRFILESMRMANPVRYTLSVNGTERDIAYLYAPVQENHYENIGMAVGCADGITENLHHRMPDKSPDKESPPSPSWFEEVTDHCYDGSCVLDQWRVVQTAPLLAEHDSQAATLAHVNSGDVLRVHRLLSEVSPVRAEVVYDHERFLQGDVFYILNGLGEGFYRIWYYGRVLEQSLEGISLFQYDIVADPARCPSPSPQCWAQAPAFPDEVWWGYVSTPEGIKGWLRQPDAVVDTVLQLQ